ncbi:MAG: type II secretion system protein [Candidatus Aenigmatarchaeota archaeon]
MSKKGFTLIELAIVLLVIGILAGVVLRNLGGFTATARDSRRQADLRNVQTYLSQYFLKQGFYPTATDWITLESTLRDAGIIEKGGSFPNDPLKGRTYEYFPCTNLNSQEVMPTHYVLRATLEATRLNTAEQFFKDALKGVPGDWGWSCQGNVGCATSTVNTDRYCVGL